MFLFTILFLANRKCEMHAKYISSRYYCSPVLMDGCVDCFSTTTRAERRKNKTRRPYAANVAASSEFQNTNVEYKYWLQVFELVQIDI